MARLRILAQRFVPTRWATGATAPVSGISIAALGRGNQRISDHSRDHTWLPVHGRAGWALTPRLGASLADRRLAASRPENCVTLADFACRDHDGTVMQIGSTQIIDTFAEAFRMRYARLVITAADDYWLNAALTEISGYASSVIACDAEVGVERRLVCDETPDGRPGAAVLVFGFSTDALAKAIPNRVGQCVMTCPTTAVFNGLLDAEETISLGKHIRFFGDGYQKSKLLGKRRYWRIPVMDGEFVVDEKVGVEKGVAGGNIILQGANQPSALAAARRASEAISNLAGVIAPFPGGVVRSGSKVGSKYKKLKASVNEAYCPTLRGRVETELVDGANAAYEIVVNGVDEKAVAEAMKVLIESAAGEGVLAIGAGNYGGKLGKFQFKLREVISA